MPVEQLSIPGIQLEDALRAVAVNSSMNASRALTRWFQRAVRLETNGFECVPITSAAELAGPSETVVAAIHMTLTGDITGDVLLAIPEETALMLVDTLLGVPPGTSKEFGELERSCLQETANIVGTSFANCLAHWLNVAVVPAAPIFAHDMSCAVVQPLILQQAAVSDEAWLSKTEFEFDSQSLDWRLLLMLSSDSVELLRQRCNSDEVREKAMHAVAVNSAFNASHALSRWLHRHVRLETLGFQRIAMSDAMPPEKGETPVAALHSEFTAPLHGHALLMMPLATAGELVGMLMPESPAARGEFDEMACSCLQETTNIIVTAFANCLARWLDLSTTPLPPEIRIDLAEALFGAVVLEQAAVSDEILLSKVAFRIDGKTYDCDFFLLPTPSSFRLIETFCR